MLQTRTPAFLDWTCRVHQMHEEFFYKTNSSGFPASRDSDSIRFARTQIRYSTQGLESIRL